MDRCIIFGDSNSFITNILLEEILKLNKKHKYFDIIYIIDTQREYKPKNFLKILAILFVKFIFNKKFRTITLIKSIKFLYTDLYKIGKKYRIPVKKVSSIKSKEFLSFLEQNKVDVGIAVGCPQIFSSDVIRKFKYLVNYHNSLLPKYRGLCATSWSIYYGEKETGFTFHIVNDGIDEGNILIQGGFPIDNRRSAFEMEIIKTEMAKQKLLELMIKIKNREEGEKQQGKGSYWGRKEFEKITIIENPEELTMHEILKRLEAFEILKIRIGRKLFPVTDAVYTNEQKGPFYIKTKDGFLKIKRILYMPISLYLLYLKLFKRRNND